MILEERFEYVVPVFPWLSRELGGRSKNIHGSDRFRILTLFPRRPKLSSGKDILVTINYELVLVAEIGKTQGVPVIAGCPLATNFWELSSPREIAWLNLYSSSFYDHLTPISSLKSGERITEQEITELIVNSPLHSMESFEEFIRTIRHELPSSFYGPRYKPVYFLIKDS